MRQLHVKTKSWTIAMQSYVSGSLKSICCKEFQQIIEIRNKFCWWNRDCQHFERVLLQVKLKFKMCRWTTLAERARFSHVLPILSQVLFVMMESWRLFRSLSIKLCNCDTYNFLCNILALTLSISHKFLLFFLFRFNVVFHHTNMRVRLISNEDTSSKWRCLFCKHILQTGNRIHVSSQNSYINSSIFQCNVFMHYNSELWFI